MIIDFDSASNEANIKMYGESFHSVVEFDFTKASYSIVPMNDYNVPRYRALGLLNGKVYILEFFEIIGGIRLLSIRKAHLTDEEDSDWTEEDYHNLTEKPNIIKCMLHQKSFVNKVNIPCKIATIIYPEEGILAAYQALGEGWEMRINNALAYGLRKADLY